MTEISGLLAASVDRAAASAAVPTLVALSRRPRISVCTVESWVAWMVAVVEFHLLQMSLVASIWLVQGSVSVQEAAAGTGDGQRTVAGSTGADCLPCLLTSQEQAPARQGQSSIKCLTSSVRCSETVQTRDVAVLECIGKLCKGVGLPELGLVALLVIRRLQHTSIGRNCAD